MNPKSIATYIILLTLSLTFSFYSSAQPVNNKTTRVLFIIDGSSSMLENWNEGASKFQAGKELIHDIMDSILSKNLNAEFGLRVFGHNHTVDKNNCYDTKLEVKFSPYNSDMVNGRLSLIHPQGVSPIALSLRESAEMDIISSPRYSYSIILITDGHESCGGNICQVMENLINQKINFTPYIISLSSDRGLVSQYDCMGEFMPVTRRTDFIPVIQKIMDDNNYFIATGNTVFIPKSSYNNIEKPEPDNKDTEKEEVKIVVPAPDESDSPAPAKRTAFTVNKKLDNYPTPFVKLKIVIRPYADKIDYDPLPLFSFPEEVVTATPVPAVQTPEPQPVDTPQRKSYTAITKLAPLTGPLRPLSQPGLSLKAVMIRVSPLPPFTFPREETIAAENPKPPARQPDAPKYHPLDIEKPDISEQKSTVSTEDKEDDASPGSLQIYLTNGKGKYYNSSPKMQIKNNATGEIAWEGERDIFQGVPSVISLPDAQYTILSVQSGRTAQVTIEKGKNKRVEIVVGSGNIAFAYTGTNEIPHGYIATVSKRFEQGEIVDHPTELKLQYDASNYHIEINTLPILMYNVNVEADNTTLISIPKPGNVQIMNEEELGRIEFWHNLAGQSYRFYEMSIYGDTEYQTVDLRPGTYEVKYPFVTPEGERVMKVKTIQLQSLQELKLKLD